MFPTTIVQGYRVKWGSSGSQVKCNDSGLIMPLIISCALTPHLLLIFYHQSPYYTTYMYCINFGYQTYFSKPHVQASANLLPMVIS